MTKKENLIRTIKRNNPVWIPYRYDSLTLLRSRHISVQPSDGGRDDWGVTWIPTNTPEGSFPDDSHPVINVDGVSEYKAPETDWRDVTIDLRQQIEEIVKKDTLIIGYNELTLFNRAQVILGTNNFLMASILDSEKIEVLLDKIVEYQKLFTKSIMESGCEGVRFTDDWGIQASMFISPIQWKRYIKPRMKILYDIVKMYGGLVFQHSCGHIEEIIPDLIEMGCDVLDPCQPAANDIFRWKREYGSHLSFMGGLDTQSYLSFGTTEDVKREVKKVLSVMGENGGYIAAPSHTISIPESNRKAMVDAINEFNAMGN